MIDGEDEDLAARSMIKHVAVMAIEISAKTAIKYLLSKGVPSGLGGVMSEIAAEYKVSARRLVIRSVILSFELNGKQKAKMEMNAIRVVGTIRLYMKNRALLCTCNV